MKIKTSQSDFNKKFPNFLSIRILCQLGIQFPKLWESNHASQLISTFASAPYFLDLVHFKNQSKWLSHNP